MTEPKKKACINFPHDAFCMHHNGRAPKDGGEWIVSASCRRRRWICANCSKARRQRRAANGDVARV